MAKVSDKQLAVDKAKIFLIGVETEISPIALPSGTHDYIYIIIRTIAEIYENEVMASPTYQQLLQLTTEYSNNHKIDISNADNKIAAGKEKYAMDYLLKFLTSKASTEQPTKADPTLKYWE